MSLTLDVSATFPDGTSVGVYGINTQSADTRAAPGGTPVETATVSSGAVTLNQVVEDRSYLLIGWVSGEWRRTGFTVNQVAEGGGGGGGGAPTGAAGGVLAGDYPNPSFADNMATQTELDVTNSTITTIQGTQTLINSMVGTLATSSVRVVLHGTNGSAARPSGVTTVLWVGSMVPVNATDNDIYLDTGA